MAGVKSLQHATTSTNFQHPTKTHSIILRHGYFLREDPALFDAGFFGISALEPERMILQQWLLLEVAWGRFESAGETDWRGKNPGVMWACLEKLVAACC
jgi:acyl transferase domain-containing protein